MPEDAAIVVTPAANPAGLGLVAFGLTTVLLSLVNAGVLPAGGEGVVIPLALAFGGLMQIFAGAFEFKLGNTFGMTAFLSYGAFWWWFAFLLLFAHNHWIDISAAGADGRRRASAVGSADSVPVDQHLPAAEDPVPDLPHLVGDIRPARLRRDLGQRRSSRISAAGSGSSAERLRCTAASASSPTRPSGERSCRWARDDAADRKLIRASELGASLLSALDEKLTLRIARYVGLPSVNQTASMAA